MEATNQAGRVRARGRWARRALALLAAAASLHLALVVALNTSAVESRLRARVEAALERRLGPYVLEGAVSVDPLLRVAFGPLALSARAGAPPVVRVDRVRVRPSLPALLAGRAEAASILLGSVAVRATDGGRDLRALGRRLAARRDGGGGAGAPAGPLPKLKLRGVVVEATLRGAPALLGPFDADLRIRRGDVLRVEGEVALRGGGEASFEAERGRTGWRGRLSAEDLGPGTVPEALRSPSAYLAAGRLSLSAEGEAARDLSTAWAEVRAAAEGISLAGTRVGLEPVDRLAATATGRLEWERATRRLALRGGRASLLGAAGVEAEGAVDLGAAEAFSVALRAEHLDFQALAAALPEALAVPAGAPRPPGTLDARLALAGPLRAPAEWTVTASLDLARMRAEARRAPPPAVAGPFEHAPRLEAGPAPRLLVGPASPDFVPIAELPEHVVRAVTAAEDGGFFGHPGFDFLELRNAFAQGAEAGRVVRGGSTISQQVAKNLYLTGERTFARKVREALVTVALEASLPKRRILEIYLNVAEWGPGVWGIGPAARHWFGKDARALTVREAAFLASIIPSPVRAEAMRLKGALTDHGELRVTEVLVRMGEQGALDREALARALEEPLTFRGAATPSAAAPLPAAAPPGR